MYLHAVLADALSPIGSVYSVEKFLKTYSMSGSGTTIQTINKEYSVCCFFRYIISNSIACP